MLRNRFGRLFRETMGGRSPHAKLSEREKLDLRYGTCARISLTDADRASQRTFDGAYARTALLQLSFAITIMRLFQSDFFWVGLACCVQAIGLLVTALYRYWMTLRYEENFIEAIDLSRSRIVVSGDRTIATEPTGVTLLPRFTTAGIIVACATAITFLVEVAIIVLIVRM